MLDRLNVTFFMKPGCHLCEEVADTLDDLQQQFPFTVAAIDITSDPAIFARLWSQIPVVEIAGTELRAPINPTRLATTIARAVRSHTTEKV